MKRWVTKIYSFVLLVTHEPTQFKVRFTLFGVKFHFPSTESSLWAFAERGQVIIQATVTMNKIQ